MFGITDYWMFLASSILLNITPGADIIYVISRASIGGRKVGIVSAFGICTGILIHTVFASLGLSLILKSSAVAFNIMKMLGTAYLVYMGIKALAKEDSILTANETKDEKLSVVFRQGVLANALNPKVALFFLALLPQFVATDNSYGPVPFLLLGLTFFTTSIIWCIFLAYIASFASRLLNKSERISKMANKITGIIYIVLGLNILR